MKYSLLLFLIFSCHYSVNANDWIYSLEEGRIQSFAENKLILVDFWATWCGPCKKMDSEVWNKEEVNKLQNNYVSVKIDIDANKELALQYNIKAIPAILLIDGLGNVVHQSSGYKNKLEMEEILGSFKNNIKHLNQAIGVHANHEKDAARNLVLAKGYQKYIDKSKNRLGSGFLENSIVYFNKAKRLAKKAKDHDLERSIELSRIYNDIILNNPKKVIQQTSKLLRQGSLSKRNRSLAYYTLIEAFRLKGDKVSEKKYFKKLEKLSTSKIYVKKLEIR